MVYLETVRRSSTISRGAPEGDVRRGTVVPLRPAVREPAVGELRLALLGPPAVELAGRPLAFRTRKALALLLYLAVARGPQPRDLLAALLWPESDQHAARTMLRSTLAAVRRALGEAAGGGRLVTTGDTVALDPAGVALDLAALERAARAAEAAEAAEARAPAGGEAARRAALLALLEEAAGAYHGDFLAGFALPDAPQFDDWASARREEAHRRLGQVLARLAELRAAGGEFAAAAAAARRWAAHDPLDEAAHRALMRALAAAGDRAGALAAYARCRAVLRDELGVAPAPETEALAAQLRRAAPCPAAPAGGPPAVPRPGTAARRPLVGRAAEFGRLVEHYASAARGKPRVVVLDGEAGIGKTRLAGEFLGWAAAQGATVLRGRAHQAGGGLPYGPLVEALRPALAAADLRAALPPTTLGELARLWPELGEHDPSTPAPTGDPLAARARLFEAVARAATALAGGTAAERRPLVLSLDDLQWADRTTLGLLAHALRRWAAAGCPVLALLALRSEEAGAALERWLAGLGREVAVATLELGPLDEAATAELAATLGLEAPAAAGAGPGDFGRWLHADTGGQPLFVVETARALVDRGPLPVRPEDARPATRPGSPPVGPVPPRVRAAIRARLARLGADAAALMAAAAVLVALGAEVTFPRLARVAGLGEDAALAALDEALARRLLREAGGTGYAFTNPKVSEVAAVEAGRARRAVFHRRAQAALAEEGGPARVAPGLARPALADEQQAAD